MEPFIGQLMLCGLPFAPVGWLDCDGSIVGIRQFTALYALLGNRFGGNGQTTFALPDLRSRVMVGMGTQGGNSYALGNTAGVETVAITTATMAAHGHGMNAATPSNGLATPIGNSFAGIPGGRGGGGQMYAVPPANTTLTPGVVQPVGGGGSHSNIQPYLALRYVIATQGTYPARP